MNARVLVTGSSGRIGRHVVADLQDRGATVVEFDRVHGHDILEAAALVRPARGCDAIVHAAAMLARPENRAADILDVNVRGTWNVLRAAEECGARRVVYLSSAQALGVFMGGHAPDYLPIDDDHPCRPYRPYGVSKLAAEGLCRSLTETTGIATICLRPPGVFFEDTYARIRAARKALPSFEWEPIWEYGAFLDVADMVSAVHAALTCADPGHVRLLLCAADVSSAQKTSRQLARDVLPDVTWRGGGEYEREPFRALVDCRRAHDVLGWSARVRWRPE